MSAGDEVVGATWREHSMAGHHYEDLLADGRVVAWTEPPFGETLYPGDGDGDPDYNNIGNRPGPVPRSFCLECAGCTAGTYWHVHVEIQRGRVVDAREAEAGFAGVVGSVVEDWALEDRFRRGGQELGDGRCP